MPPQCAAVIGDSPPLARIVSGDGVPLDDVDVRLLDGDPEARDIVSIADRAVDNNSSRADARMDLTDDRSTLEDGRPLRRLRRAFLSSALRLAISLSAAIFSYGMPCCVTRWNSSRRRL